MEDDESEDKDLPPQEPQPQRDDVMEDTKADKGSPTKAGRRKADTKEDVWKNQLMLAEELEDLPEDLPDWRSILCPSGKRCLVVAAKGKTKVFGKSGKHLKTIFSLLPGGSPHSQ